MADNEIVLSYHDSLLKKSDYKLLSGRNWINDNIIEFCLEYFQNDHFKRPNLFNIGEKTKHYLSDRVTFIGPSFAQLIKMTESADDAKMLLESVNFEHKQLVLIPLNDQKSITSVGGSHWSLLAFYPDSSLLQHFDSSGCPGFNEECAQMFYNKLKLVFPKLILMNSPCVEQDNCYNCGIHVIANAEAVMKQIFHIEPNLSVPEIATAQAIQEMRSRITDIIDRLAAEN